MLSEGTIARLKVRAGRGDSPALGQAVARQIGSTDLSVPGLPPSAILMVRHLRDPLPGRLSAHPSAVVADPRWQHALRTRLDSLRDSASRPQRGRVSADAESLLFTDEAQLVACLACSLLDGPGTPPWWRRAAAAYVPIGSLFALLGARVQLLPAVLGVLADWGAEVRVAAALSEDEATTLARRMAGAFALGPAWPVARPLSTASPRGSANPDAPAADLGCDNEAGGAPWEALWRQDAATPLLPSQQLLICTALTLHRAPSLARSQAFGLRVARWLLHATPTPRGHLRDVATADGDSPPGPAAASEPAAASNTTPDNMPPASGARRASRTPVRPHVRTGSEIDAADTSETGATQARSSTESAMHKSLPPLVARQPVVDGGAEESLDGAIRSLRFERPEQWVEGLSRSGMAGDSTPVDAENDLAVELRTVGVPTELGGALYLINLLVQLDLPACFEHACALASAVGAAGTLEALARALLPPLPQELADDSLWAVLAQLDMRAPGEPPRASGLRCGELRLPLEWFAGWAGNPGAMRWVRRAGRLLVWSDAGYRLVDVPVCGTPERQVVTELSNYASAGMNRPAQRGLVRDCPSSDLDHLRTMRWPDAMLTWLEFVVPAVRHRLARALGKPNSQSLDVLEEIARCPGRLHLTDTHLDLSASLQSISVRLRLAGLDRSPGWVPGLGRVVLFHFD